MKIFLLRHADATHSFPDASRALSPEGIEQIKALAKAIDHNHVQSIKNIWHSPLLRAQQTAALFAKYFKLDCKVRTHEDLVPGGPIDSLAYELETLDEDTLIVGHNPHMEALASFLLKRDSQAPVIIVKKASITCLNHSPNPDQSWILAWHLYPSLLA